MDSGLGDCRSDEALVIMFSKYDKDIIVLIKIVTKAKIQITKFNSREVSLYFHGLCDIGNENTKASSGIIMRNHKNDDK